MGWGEHEIILQLPYFPAIMVTRARDGWYQRNSVIFNEGKITEFNGQEQKN